MRGADPAIFLIPGVGMFSFGADSPTARIAGEFYINAINVIIGAESVSTYQPVPEAEKFRVEYWMLEELKLRRRPAPKPLSGKVALVTGGGSGIGRAISESFADAGAVVVVIDVNLASARATSELIGSDDRARAIEADVTDEEAVRRAVDDAVRVYGGIDIVVNNAGLSLSKSLLETTEADWDLQHDVMAKGSFLVSKHAASAMIAQGTGGDIVYIVSKNAVVAGPNNLAYGSAKASQAHQVRLLAAELGKHGIRVNGINPDGVVQGSGIFAGGWGADRAKVYGVPEEDLGKFYADRTLLKQEVLPEHVALAALALVGGSLSQTTGLIIPVDSGVVPAFLR
jgi:NAD(P)-dependent dehydrogenase (short-subunit alcohol dehydrogenase family)